MASATHNADFAKELMKMVPRRGIAGYKELRPILERIAKAASVTFTVEPSEAVSEIEGGIHIKWP